MIWDSGQGGMSQVRRQGGTDTVQGGTDSVQGGAHAQLSGHSYGATATAAACVREREREGCQLMDGAPLRATPPGGSDMLPSC